LSAIPPSATSAVVASRESEPCQTTPGVVRSFVSRRARVVRVLVDPHELVAGDVELEIRVLAPQLGEEVSIRSTG
jgi:hypothetical protein